MKFEDLKENDKVYSLHYFDNKRTFETFIVKKITRYKIYLKNRGWSIPKKEFGVVYFPIKREVFENALKLHEEKLTYSKILEKEIIYLKNKIKQLGVKNG